MSGSLNLYPASNWIQPKSSQELDKTPKNDRMAHLQTIDKTLRREGRRRRVVFACSELCCVLVDAALISYLRCWVSMWYYCSESHTDGRNVQTWTQIASKAIQRSKARIKEVLGMTVEGSEGRNKTSKTGDANFLERWWVEIGLSRSARACR